MYDNAQTASKKDDTDGGYTIIYYPAAEFKRRTFTCLGVEYNNYGRVNKMTFKEYK